LETFQTILFVAPVLLFSVIAHEYAHGYAALKQGDTTAQQLGRLTWNPAKHIDPFLTILMPLFMGFASNWQVMLGGAKPVPVNPANYRNLRRGDIIVSLAGVFVNLLLAIACTVMIAVFGFFGSLAPATGAVVGVLQVLMIYGVAINLMLIAFNLIPIPPLDGSHVMKYLLPPALAAKYERVAGYGLIVLIALLYFGGDLLNTWMAPAFFLQRVMLGSVAGLLDPSTGRWLP